MIQKNSVLIKKY